MKRMRMYYPTWLGLFLVVICYILKFNPKIKGFEKVLDGTISFSSIVVGFVGALLAIILSISRSAVIKHLYSYIDEYSNKNGKDLLFNYFKSSIFSGFIIVLVSMYMYIIINKEKISIFDHIIIYFWVFIATFFVLSTYRIISIIMHTLFKHENHESNKYEQSTKPVSNYDEMKERNKR